jgi:hypothetical protein
MLRPAFKFAVPTLQAVQDHAVAVAGHRSVSVQTLNQVVTVIVRLCACCRHVVEWDSRASGLNCP